nr:hypothetical protein [uncultured Duganella sp.]
MTIRHPSALPALTLATVLALAAVAPPSAHGAEPLSPHLVGTWDTGQTPYADGTRQIELYLGADGAGGFLGIRRPGGQSMGMPIDATLEGELIKVRPSGSDKGRAEDVARLTLTCHHDPSGPTLVCRDPVGVTLTMTRRSATATDDIAAMLATARQ